MNLGIVGQAAGLFAVTNIDDILVLSLFFARGAGHPRSARRIVLGQYLGFVAILAVAVAAAFGATFLPEWAVPYLGLLPLALGLKAAWRAWKHRDDEVDEQQTTEGGPRALEVAAVTFANGGDNIGVYVPVFTTAGVGGGAGAGAVVGWLPALAVILAAAAAGTVWLGQRRRSCSCAPKAAGESGCGCKASADPLKISGTDRR